MNKLLIAALFLWSVYLAGALPSDWMLLCLVPLGVGQMLMDSEDNKNKEKKENKE